MIVPQNLQYQWLEDEKFTRGLKVVSLHEKTRHTLTDLFEADVVVCTVQYLRSSTYTSALIDTLRQHSIHLKDPREVLRDKGMSTHLMQTFAHATASDAFPAFVELVHWSRIILDEVHEYFAYGISAREKLRVLNSLRSDMWWGVSGTPYGSSDHVTRMFEFLRSRTSRPPSARPS